MDYCELLCLSLEDLQEIRETYPSVAEELFSAAFTRLKRIEKEKQDALESFKKGVIQNVEADDHRRPDKSSSYQSQRT